MPESERKNRFPGKCRVCAKWVEAEEGTCPRKDERTGYWEVRCKEHPLGTQDDAVATIAKALGGRVIGEVPGSDPGDPGPDEEIPF